MPAGKCSAQLLALSGRHDTATYVFTAPALTLEGILSER